MWFEFDTLIIIICCISLFSFYWICLIFIYLFTYYTFHLFIHIFLFTYLITSSNFSETNSTFNHLNYFDFRYARDCLTNFNWIILFFYPLLFYFYLQSHNFISFFIIIILHEETGCYWLSREYPHLWKKENYQSWFW